MSVSIQRPKLLIVEGRDEEMFFGACLRNHLRLMDVQVLPIGGKTNLTRNLHALVNDPVFSGVQSLAVVRDADLTPTGTTVPAAVQAFDSIRGTLGSLRLACPAGHGGFTTAPPRIGVFIMPNGVDDGMLETLCVQAVSAEPEFHCVADYFACLQGHGVVPNNLHKARAHAWLASRVEPDRRVGEAAQAGYWPWTDPAFNGLCNFLRAM